MPSAAARGLVPIKADAAASINGQDMLLKPHPLGATGQGRTTAHHN